MKVDKRRIFSLNDKPKSKGPIIYWMSRDQRVKDNWSLLYAQELSKELNQPFVVVFCLCPNFLNATLRQYGFMLKGLEELEKNLLKFNIPFYLLLGEPSKEIPKLANKMKAGVILTDFDPLKIKKKWQQKVAKIFKYGLYAVDAHNIVPCPIASTKQEFGAYTLRPKINKVLKEYFSDFLKVKKQKYSLPPGYKKVNWKKAWESLKIDNSVPEITWCIPGEKAANLVLKKFLKKIGMYDRDRNNPTKDAQSNLSVYLHFGQISAQRVAIEVNSCKAPLSCKKAFLEELIIRKELSDNFCYYNHNYNSVEGFPAWAKKTLFDHAKDKREYIYTLKEFERAKTHDNLWNAAQIQMVKRGKMHGYMRMYWAKKILEWSKTISDAIKIAIYLNDKYELDGRDPNGYTGIAWSIGGVHDRAWGERDVFGKIRYMSFNGCKSKFDVEKYINMFKK